MERVFFKRWGKIFLVFWFFLQCGALFFHVGEGGFFRGASYAVLPAAFFGFEPIWYHRVVETAHAFVALGVAPNYDDAFSLALAFIVRDVRIAHLLEKDISLSLAAFPEETVRALRDAGISSSEEKRFLLLPLARLHAAQVLTRVRLSSQDVKINDILEKLSLGMPFTDAAYYFSDDESSQAYGALGKVFVRDMLDWQRGILDASVGEVRDGFFGDDALWILRMTDRGGTGDGAWVMLSGIAVRYPTLEEVFAAADFPRTLLLVW